MLFDPAGVVWRLGLYYPPISLGVMHSKHLRCFEEAYYISPSGSALAGCAIEMTSASLVYSHRRS